MRSRVTTPPGGIMTSQGAVTGEVVIATAPTLRHRLSVRVAYVGSGDLYRVAGSPVSDLDHDGVVARLTTDPGRDDDGNPASTDLRRTV